MRFYLLLIGCILFATSCGGEVNTSTEIDKEPEIEKDTILEAVQIYSEDQKYDDFARFIAGSEGKDNSELKNIEELPEWKSYRTNLDNLWKQTNAKLPVIKSWTDEELKDVNSEAGTLFYPFSGPDFLHADLFFPIYDNIVMVALEPIGDFPDLNEKQNAGTLAPYLSHLNQALNAILKLSFFRTLAMVDDFQSEMDGTLHVLAHFISRTGHNLLYQEKVAILPDGTLSNDLSNISDSTYIGNRFYFKRNDEDKVKTLTYFAINIQNTAYHSRGGLIAKGLDSRKDVVSYFKKVDIKATYIKSASYLMHRPTFSIMRSLILDESEYLLQDDSGIPVQYFDESKWNLTFYGNYSFPIPLFAERHQEDLKEIYIKKELNVKPLPFGIGYQYVKGTSNLMLARKK